MSWTSIRAPCRTAGDARRLLYALCLASAYSSTAVMGETAKMLCKRATDCDGDNYECIDRRCMCDPCWAKTGPNCDIMSWTSWTMVVVLSLTSVCSFAMLVELARDGGSRLSGSVELAKMLCLRRGQQDLGSTTVRVLLVSMLLDVVSYTAKILTTVGVMSVRSSSYWNARLFFPLSEGLTVLPATIVISVWVDVANNSMSRVKSKKKLATTKKVLQLGTACYIALLLVMCLGERLELAMVVQLSAIALGVSACGAGASKLCNTLRALGSASATIADTVFKVSRSMGISLYMVFIGNTMLLASYTRKSDPTNLAVFGVLISALAKCFLNKAIFEYMIESTRAKRARAEAASRFKKSPFPTLKPAVRLISSLHFVRKKRAGKVIVEEGQVSNSSFVDPDNSSIHASPHNTNTVFPGLSRSRATSE